MKPRTLMIICASISFIFSACEKDGDEDTTSPKGQLVRIQQGTDPDIWNDTVFLVRYNEKDQVSRIVDSLYQDSVSFEYDPAGRLTNITSLYEYTASYQYDGSGSLSQIDYVY